MVPRRFLLLLCCTALAMGSLPGEARDQTAHAWVELNGRDVGPPPGRNGHAELARFP